VTFERRRTYTRWLTAAAAVVVVAGLGVIVAQSGGGDDDQSSTAFEATADTTARAESSTEFTEQSGPPADTADALTSSGIAADDASGGDADSGAVAEAPSPEATEAAEAPAAPADAAAAEPTTLAVMESPEDLGAVAAEAQAAVDDGSNRDVLAPPCGDDAFDDDIDTYVATGTYRDRSVMIGIDDEDDRAIAVDPVTCEIVAEAPLP
jgi:hypothetical protein